MANEPIITIVGNTGGDAELRFTPNGAAVANFSVAVTPRTKNQAGEWVDGEATWYRVNCWRSLAENVAESIVSGMRVIVQGRLQLRKWQNDQKEGQSLEITADAVGPDLMWAQAKVRRAERQGGYDQGGQQRQQGGGQYGGNQGGQRRQAPQNDDPWGSAPANTQTGSAGGWAEEPPF